MTELLESWKDFNVAMVGAAAALAGLAIVAASVNIEAIVKSSQITARLGAAIATFVLVIAVSALGLVPGIPLVVYGVLTIVATLAVLVFQANAARQLYGTESPENRFKLFRAGLGFVPLAAYLAGGVLLTSGLDAAGVVVFAAGALLAIAAVLFISWIALVEILR